MDTDWLIDNSFYLIISVAIVLFLPALTYPLEETPIPEDKKIVEENEKVETCSYDWNCGNQEDFACIEGKCNKVECEYDYECSEKRGILQEDKYNHRCIDYNCVNYGEICRNVAKLDFNLKNPRCYDWISNYEENKNECYCYERKLISPEKIIERNHSIQKIYAEYEKGKEVTFRLKE